jgi:hypothetical protein
MGMSKLMSMEEGRKYLDERGYEDVVLPWRLKGGKGYEDWEIGCFLDHEFTECQFDIISPTPVDVLPNLHIIESVLERIDARFLCKGLVACGRYDRSTGTWWWTGANYEYLDNANTCLECFGTGKKYDNHRPLAEPTECGWCCGTGKPVIKMTTQDPGPEDLSVTLKTYLVDQYILVEAWQGGEVLSRQITEVKEWPC